MGNKWNTDLLHKIIHLLTNFIFNFMDVAGIDGLEHGSEGNKKLFSHPINQDKFGFIITSFGIHNAGDIDLPKNNM